MTFSICIIFERLINVIIKLQHGKLICNYQLCNSVWCLKVLDLGSCFLNNCPFWTVLAFWWQNLFSSYWTMGRISHSGFHLPLEIQYSYRLQIPSLPWLSWRKQLFHQLSYWWCITTHCTSKTHKTMIWKIRWAP